MNLPQRALVVTNVVLVVLAFWWHEATEPYEAEGGDGGSEWRQWAGVVVLVLVLGFMAYIAAAGFLDDIDRRRIDAGLPTRAESGRHRRLLADQAITTHGAIRQELPVVWVPEPAYDVVLDEQPTGGER